MKTNFLFLFLSITSSGICQSFSGKSNSVALDYTKSVVATTLPAISCITPSLDRTNSTATNVLFEAEVTSDVALKIVRLEWKNGGETRTKDIPITGDEYKKSVRQSLNLLD